jgi:hypothetical protein
LTELEEQVERIRAKLNGEAVPSRSVKSQMAASTVPTPVIAPDLQQWKQSVIKSKLHGDRAKIYIPTTSGKSNTYHGQWAKGRKEGFGEHMCANRKYAGFWKDGLRDGEGTLWVRLDANSEWVRVYKGEWKEDKRHGRGVNYYSTGDIYDGFFEHGLRSAIGKLFLADGSRIEGQFRNDQADGWGTLYCPNGDWFEGYWRDGMREGPGIWYYESRQQCLKGEWHKNIAKFGVLEDFPSKETNEKSNYMPRVELVDYAAVLRAEKEELNENRTLDKEELGEQWVPPEAEATGADDELGEEDTQESGRRPTGKEQVSW